MVERSPYLSGLNLLLGLFTIFVAVGLGVILVGPGRSTLDGAKAHLHEVEQQLEAYGTLRAAQPPLAPAERSAIDDLWRGLAGRFPDVVAESDLAALAASFFRSHGVEHIQVSFETANDADAALAKALLQSPDGSSGIEVVPNRIRVRFEIPYAKAREILAAVQSDEISVRVDSADLQRTDGGVAVDLRLTAFSRSRRS